MTTPKFLDGIPVTLSEVRDNKQEDPLMSPFPSWADQNEMTCQGPVSVYRVQVSHIILPHSSLWHETYLIYYILGLRNSFIYK